jgi:hypothetical protein
MKKERTRTKGTMVEFGMSSRAECNLAYYGIGIGIFNMQMRSVG